MSELQSPIPAADLPASHGEAGAHAMAEALRGSFVFIKAVMVVLLLVFIFSGFFTLKPQEQAVVLRFGKLSRPITFGKPAGAGGVLQQPGLYLAWPSPIDEVKRIAAGRLQSVDSTAGWYAVTAAQEAAGQEPPAGLTLSPARDGYTITADENIIHIRAKLEYEVSDLWTYDSSFENAKAVALSALNNAIFYASARFTAAEAVSKQAEVRATIEDRVRQLVQSHGLPIIVAQNAVTLNKLKEPRQVADVFQQARSAEQQKNTAINDARNFKLAVESRRQGDYEAVINAGESEARRLVLTAQADAKAFLAQLPAFEKDAELFKQRRLTETIARVLTNKNEKWFLPERAGGQPRQLRLLLGPEPLEAKDFQPQP